MRGNENKKWSVTCRRFDPGGRGRGGEKINRIIIWSLGELKRDSYRGDCCFIDTFR